MTSSFARIIKKNRHPGQLHFTFFHQKVNLVIFIEGG